MEPTEAQQLKTLESPDLQAARHFAAAVLHDIHNPLEAATGLAYLVREEAEQPERVRRYIGLLEEQLSHITTIARQALSFYRQPMKSLDLVSVAEAAIRIHDAKIREKGLRLTCILAEDALIYGHPGEILQVLSNVLANAVDALQREGTLSLRIRKSAGEIRVTILDNGHGIPSSIMKEVFNPLFTTKGQHGTGLGLAISKQIVARHRGTIKMRSSTRQGRSGTAFRISFPRATALAVSAPVPI
jgi:signal transduction histidine kinase